MAKKTKPFTIHHVDLTSDDGTTIEKFDFVKFDKTAIEDVFLLLVDKMNEEGQEVEYWKEDEEYAYISLLVVEFHKGIPRKQVIRGDKVYYAEFHRFNRQ